jgi:hypothetical protein
MGGHGWRGTGRFSFYCSVALGAPNPSERLEQAIFSHAPIE